MNQLHPIWFRLPKRFYDKVELLAGSAGLKAEEALEFALDVLGRFVVTAQRNKIVTKELFARLWPLLRALQKDADAHQVNLIQAVEDAVKLYHIYGPLNMKLPGHGGPTERKSAAALAVLRWAKIPQEERSKLARQLALKRWGSTKGARPNDAKEPREG